MTEKTQLTIDGDVIDARVGEPLAVSLIAADRLVFGRSVKYHRPRGPVCLDGQCDGCLMRVDGVPNVMSCRHEVRGGEVVETQNVIGSANTDLLSATDWFFPNGMDHHHMFTRFRPLNLVMKKIARRIAGIGELPDKVQAPIEIGEREVDVLVVGGGEPGRAAARAAGAAAERVALVDEGESASVAGVTVLSRHRALAVYREGGYGFTPGEERAQTAEELASSYTRQLFVVVHDLQRDQLVRIRPQRLILATGTREGAVALPGADLPGVMSVSAITALLARGVRFGDSLLLIGDEGALRPLGERFLALGGERTQTVAHTEVHRFIGGTRVKGAYVRVGGRTRRVSCDAVGVTGPIAGVYELAAQAGAALRSSGGAFFVTVDKSGRTSAPDVFAVGTCTGSEVDAVAAGRLAAGTTVVEPERAEEAPLTVTRFLDVLPKDRSDKVMVCRCEDVTLHEIEQAVERGHRDLESVKRYTGFGTGWCQGKQCVALCAGLLPLLGEGDKQGIAADRPITPRPPLHPIPTAQLARVIRTDIQKPKEHLPAIHRAKQKTPKLEREGLPEEADIVVVGGGIMGLATAYHLARLSKDKKRGPKRIIVLEKSYLCSGASGRNGGGVRAQWSSERNIALMKESLDRCATFATDMRINVWFRRGGYLFLARSNERAKQLEESARLQNAHGLPTKILTPKETLAVVPELDVSNVVVSSHNPDDAVVFPWPFVWGYANACKKLGASVHTFTEVQDVETESGKVTGVITNRGRVRTKMVVNACGAYSPEVAKMVGVSLPNVPHRHEICSTEPLKPFLKPLVADLETGLYFSQSMRGEIVGGCSNELVPGGLNQDSSLRFLGLYARELTKTMPVLGHVRVLRQWAGCYDLTPDGNPIIGRVDGVEGMIMICGFMGHGFMMAPVISERVAKNLLDESAEQELFDRWSLRRFTTGELLEETMILG